MLVKNEDQVLDLNDIRVFASVASLKSFSGAGRTLRMPKSSVSRSVARLEAALGTTLVQRTTRELRLTESGIALAERCADVLMRLDETIDFVGSLSARPRGLLRISVGIGFGYHVLSGLLPLFLEEHDEVVISLELTSRPVDLVAEGIDVAIGMGPVRGSRLGARRLGNIQGYLCAAPAYLERRGKPSSLEELRNHDTVEMLDVDGRPPRWTFFKGADASETVRIEPVPRMSVNDPMTIHRLVVNGAGIGCVSAYLCGSDFEAGRLIRVLPEWRMPAVEVHAVFPSNREQSPTVRAFVEFMMSRSVPGELWQHDPLSTRADGSFQ